MNTTYDLVVIGTGTAAQVASARVRNAGWSVAIVDYRPFGGTCALRGCDPKKVLVGAADVIDAARRMQGSGITNGLRLEWADLMTFKRKFTDPVPQQRTQTFAKQGIDALEGTARFTAPDTVQVGSRTLKARHILLAGGATPVRLGISGERHLTTSDAFMELERLPERIVMVGGGYIAAEFSHVAACAGARVTVLQRGNRMLTHFDPDLVGWLMEKFAEIGVAVHVKTTVQAVERIGDRFRLRAQTDSGPEVFEADHVVHAAGRVADLDGLDLAAGNVAVERGRLQLNEHLQSVSNPIVYAAGDAAGKGPPLTPVASHEGKVVAANLIDGNRHRPDYRGVPSVAFTLPPIAAVGLSESEGHEQGLKVRIKSAKASDWYTARRVREPVYGYKTLVEEGSERILGAHLVGPHADEVINLFALAIKHGLTVEDIKTTMFAYPTSASDIGYML